MSMDAHPPLMQLGGEENFAAYEREFNRTYFFPEIIDVLGNRVNFQRSSCRHVCYKRDEEDRSSRRKRDIWSQERAERIPWIYLALTLIMTEIRPDKDYSNRLNYLLIVPADPIANLMQEYYCAVAERTAPKQVEFITAFPLDQQAWASRRRTGKALYPIKPKAG